MELNEIQTVKIQGDGYLVNGTMSVPKAEGNRHYKLIKEWIEAGNTVDAEYTDEELAEQEVNKQIAEAKQYLADTDWVVVKINEANINGDDISELMSKYVDILTARADARATINSLE